MVEACRKEVVSGIARARRELRTKGVRRAAAERRADRMDFGGG